MALQWVRVRTFIHIMGEKLHDTANKGVDLHEQGEIESVEEEEKISIRSAPNVYEASIVRHLCRM